MAVDYILNGTPTGGVAAALINAGGDFGVLRPFIGTDGRSYATVKTGRLTVNAAGLEEPETRTIVVNNPASLRFQDWRKIDELVLRVAKPEYQLVADLRSRDLTVELDGGLGVTVYSYEGQSDIGPAQISMSGTRKGLSDRPVYDIHNMPLPIIHKDWSFDMRQILASRRGDSPLDVTAAGEASERCVEEAEQLHAGMLPAFSYGGGAVYGLKNFPSRLSYVMTNPNHAGWTPEVASNELLAMRLQSQLAYHKGPWTVYTSPNWDVFLDADYSSAKGDNTLRKRLSEIRGIQEVKTLDFFQFLPGAPYVMMMMETKPRTMRTIVLQDLITLQWQSGDGLEVFFKVLMSITPQPRADMNGNCGIVDGTAASS